MGVNILRFVIPKSLVEYVTDDSSVRQALEKMLYHRYSAMPVIDSDGKFIGTLRSDDIFKHFMKSGSFDKLAAENMPVTEIMEKGSSRPLYHNSTVSDLIEEVKEHNFVPVVDDRGCFIGLILRRDVLNFLLKYFEDNKNES